MASDTGAVVCVDVGSTYTKALLVDLGHARVLAGTDRPTSSAADVLEVIAACRDDLAAVDPRARDAEVLACSSAGGALWIAVVGNEELVTGEAGRRVALSSGGRVVDVVALAGRSDEDVVADLGRLLAPEVSRLGRGRPRTSTTDTGPLVEVRPGTATTDTGPLVEVRPGAAATDTGPLVEGRPGAAATNTGPLVEGRPGTAATDTGPLVEGRPGAAATGTGPLVEGRPGAAAADTGPLVEGRPGNATTDTGPLVEGRPGTAATDTGPLVEGRPGAAATDTGPLVEGRAQRASKPRPDVVLLTGGTDGGNAEPLLRGARALVAAGWDGPTVVAGNRAAYDGVGAILGDRPHVLAANAVPRIGQLAPQGARAAIRDMFLAHVIGGKGLSAHDEFVAMVQGATPDVVLTGVELLAHGLDDERPGVGDVAVVDIGGATTDVYSVRTLDPELSTQSADGAGLAREVVAPTAANRTVEADLGMRWSAGGVVSAAGAEVTDEQRAAVARLVAEPSANPDDDAARAVDEWLARVAATTAVRRHAGRSRVVLAADGRVVERTGVDLREVGLLIGSGGALRHGRPGVAQRVLGALVTTADREGWQLPERARIVVDTGYLLAAIGLLSRRHPEVAHRLAATLAGDTPLG